MSFPHGSDGKRICLQCRRPGFNPWVGKILWRRKWQPTPVLLPGKFHGWRSLIGYRSWGCKETRLSDLTFIQNCIHTDDQWPVHFKRLIYKSSTFIKSFLREAESFYNVNTIGILILFRALDYFRNPMKTSDNLPR